MTHRAMHHPKGLYPLFFTELWERFGFYTIQTILILYLTKNLGWDDAKSDLLFGAFGSLLYLTPVIGGYLADRFIGFKQSIGIGGVFLILGYAIMAIPSEKTLFLGMGFVVVGMGLFKPNISSMVGELYERNDPRREAGFTIFYMGINIGSLLPSLFAGYLVNHYGWNTAFLAAACGLVLGLAIFYRSRTLLQDVGKIPHARSPKTIFYVFLATGIATFIALIQLLFQFPKETSIILVIASLVIVVAVLFSLFKSTPIEKKRLGACLILITISVGFWALYTQTWTSMMLFANRNMDLRFFGMPINAEFTQFFNPFFILALSPFLSKLWLKLDSRGKNPSTPMKFSMGLLFMSLGFLVLGLGIRLFNQEGIASPWWIVLSYLLQTTGELMLSPIGLAMITKLSPKHLVGMMMGVWFLSLSAAFAIGGGLAAWASVPKTATVIESLSIYSEAFINFGTLAGLLTVVSFLLTPFIKRLTIDPHEPIHTPKE